MAGEPQRGARDRERIREAAARIAPGTTLWLEEADDGRTEALAEFCRELAPLLPGLQLRRRPAAAGSGSGLVPLERVHFLDPPRGRELPLFLELLQGALPPAGERLARELAALDRPAELTLVVAPGCGFCPQVLRSLVPAAAASPWIRLRVIDAEQRPEYASEHGIRSVPTLILEERWRWVGAVDPGEVVRVAAARDPAELSAASLERLLKEGEARRVASWMVERKRLFPALADLLCREEWPVRLGAMVTLEEIHARAPDLAARALASLEPRLASLPERVQGDLLYLFGEIAPPALLPRLEAFAAAAGPGVEAAAREAVEAIRKKTRPDR